jgi:hypothetical protein
MFETKIFNLFRNGNIITDGVIFPNGKCVMIWRGDIQSIVIHDSIDNLTQIHCQNNDTVLILQ